MDENKTRTNGTAEKPVRKAPREGAEGVALGAEANAVVISEAVIEAIVRKQALTVDGVVRLASASLIGGLSEILGRKTADSSIVIELSGNEVRVGINLVLRFGVSVPEVAARVQEAIRASVEELTGRKVAGVRVAVRALEEAEDVAAANGPSEG